MRSPGLFLSFDSTPQVITYAACYNPQQSGSPRSMRQKIKILLLCLVATTTYVAFGQDTRGTILGRVTDSSGANVANAEITATNTATGVAVTAKTNESGNYSLP